MRSPRSWLGLATSAMMAVTQVHAITLDETSQCTCFHASIESAMSQATWDMMTMYVGNQSGQVPGLLPYADPQGYRYYWWQAGAMMGTLIDYWYYTGDTTYNDEVTTALQWQAGPLANYEPANESLQLGNDDQAFWAFSAMEAAEYNFPNPPKDEPQWLELAQAVFNLQVERWDAATCNGGLRWQVFELNVGWDYKNSITNGCLMQLAARLGKYTGNSTYTDWAEKEWNWMTGVGLISSDYHIWDGCTPTQNCTQFNHIEWTYTYAVLIYATSVMWNITQDQAWQDRTTGLIGVMGTNFFPNNIIYETSCAPTGICNSDQQSFAAYSGRFLSVAARVAPFVEPLVSTWISTSAQAAAASCTGGTTGTLCGLVWTGSAFDGKTGIGEQMNAIEFFGALLMPSKPGPLTASSGGTSKGNPSAGTGEATVLPGSLTSRIGTADRAGAGILTSLVCFALVGGAVWMVI